MRRKAAVLLVALCAVGGALLKLTPLHAQNNAISRDTIFVANTQSADPPEIYKVIPGQEPVLFATLNKGVDSGDPWIAPIGVSPNGHLYARSRGQTGTPWGPP